LKSGIIFRRGLCSIPLLLFKQNAAIVGLMYSNAVSIYTTTKIFYE